MDNLAEWHNQINAICPIESLQLLESGDYKIVFTDESTNEQRSAAVQLLFELQKAPRPDWENFYIENMALLFELLERSNNTVVVNALMIEFGKRPSINLIQLKMYWNLSIGLLRLSVDQLEELKSAIAQHHLPIQLDDSGRWI